MTWVQPVFPLPGPAGRMLSQGHCCPFWPVPCPGRAPVWPLGGVLAFWGSGQCSFSVSQPPWQPVNGPPSPGLAPLQSPPTGDSVPQQWSELQGVWVPEFEEGGGGNFCFNSCSPVPPELEAEQENHRMLPAPERQPEPRRHGLWPGSGTWAESAGRGSWCLGWHWCRCWLPKAPLEAAPVLSRGAASMNCCVMMQAGVQPQDRGSPALVQGCAEAFGGTARSAGLGPQMQPSSRSGAFLGVSGKPPVPNPSWPIPHGLLVLWGGPRSRRPRGEARCSRCALP